jgi:hypothetical protein
MNNKCAITFFVTALTEGLEECLFLLYYDSILRNNFCFNRVGN